MKVYVIYELCVDYDGCAYLENLKVVTDKAKAEAWANAGAWHDHRECQEVILDVLPT